MVKMNKDNQPICKIDEDGTKRWYLNKKLHREDGPASEYANRNKFYYLHGKRHRLDGPAVELFYGYKEWWYYGKWIKCSSQEEFERLIKLKALW